MLPASHKFSQLKFMPRNPKDHCQPGSKPKVKDRIFDAASDLFYKKGIYCVGIDAIVSEAETNKMSLYRNFESKDELVTEYIKSQNNVHKEKWDNIVNEHQDSPVEAIIAIFHEIQTKKTDSCNGCPTANVAIELRGHNHPALSLIFESRVDVLQRFIDLSQAAGAKNPSQLADTLVLLFEGCVMTKVTFPDQSWPGNNITDIVKNILKSELGSDCF